MKVVRIFFVTLQLITKTQFTIMITIKNENGVYVASFEGRLDAPAAQKAQDELEPLLANADKEIVLDCTNLEYDTCHARLHLARGYYGERCQDV
jgi:hypothetical protein